MKSTIKFVPIAVASAIASLAIFTGVALAAYTFFGDATIVTGGNPGNAAQLRSDATNLVTPYGGVRFPVPSGTTFADLTYLSADFWYEADDSCGGGSPRFQIRVSTPPLGVEKNIFVYGGPYPSYAGCTPSVWTNSGDLLEAGQFIDTSQLSGGTFYHAYGDALAAFGALPVLRVSVVVDSEWAFVDHEQTVRIDNVNINGTVETFDLPADKDACKDDGWKSLSRADSTPFKNQGDCIQFVNTGK